MTCVIFDVTCVILDVTCLILDVAFVSCWMWTCVMSDGNMGPVACDMCHVGCVMCLKGYGMYHC